MIPENVKKSFSVSIESPVEFDHYSPLTSSFQIDTKEYGIQVWKQIIFEINIVTRLEGILK